MQSRIHDPESSMGYAVGRVARALGNQLKRNFQSAGYDITQEQWIMLVFLQDRDGAPQQKLANILGKDKTTITRLVDTMERNGLLERIPGEIDRRARHIHMTEAGKDLLKRLSGIAKSTLEQAKMDIEEKRLQICREVLDEMYMNLNKAVK